MTAIQEEGSVTIVFHLNCSANLFGIHPVQVEKESEENIT